jgi:hypothetical protein
VRLKYQHLITALPYFQTKQKAAWFTGRMKIVARGGFAIHRIVEQRPVTPDYKSGGSKGQFVKVFSL